MPNPQENHLLILGRDMKIDLLVICSTEITAKLKTWQNISRPPVERWTMERRWPSEYHQSIKFHRPTNDVVNFRGRWWFECASKVEMQDNLLCI